MLGRLWNRYRYWRCRRQFAKLDPVWQSLIRFSGDDPESLKARGEFD